MNSLKVPHTWGLPNIGGPFLGTSTRIIVFWGLGWSPPILGNNHLDIPSVSLYEDFNFAESMGGPLASVHLC